ncbi:MAG: hypothetical protein JW755_12560 [Candidatus Aminicenantes bacterium]|nr:hypothetical protein [Candidatus Aminicenantes bacterium]
MSKIETYDKLEKYCPVLGHYLNFGYCRIVREGLPCSKIRSCWDGRLPVNEFLEKNFSRAELGQIFELPQNKITTLLTLIEKAQNRSG